MTKRKLKGKIDVQQLYNEGKMGTSEFYHGVTNLIKWLLMGALIKRGHWKNGVRQTNFDQEDIDDCFTYIYGKILDKYDPEKGTLATFIRTWIRGYGTVVTQKQRRQHKYLKQLLPLDFNLQRSISEEYRDHYTVEDIEDYLDSTEFNSVDPSLKEDLFNVLGNDIDISEWSGA